MGQEECVIGDGKRVHKGGSSRVRCPRGDNWGGGGWVGRGVRTLRPEVVEV